MADGRYVLTELEWQMIEPFLPKNPVVFREVLTGVFFSRAPALPGRICPRDLSPIQQSTIASTAGGRLGL
jgi:aldehyde:ferredoxin oxidoreductase